MTYFLRFTNTPEEDLKLGTSLLDLPSLDKPIVLDGLCGYSFSDTNDEGNIMSDYEMEKKVRVYQSSVWYNGTPVMFLGNYIENNVNGEGVIFKAIEIYKKF